MVKEKKKTSRGLEVVLTTAFVLGTFGSILGLESNIQPFNNVRIQDTSFRTYLEQNKRQYGDGVGTYAMAIWTYPGARVGAAIHNYRLPENSEE